MTSHRIATARRICRFREARSTSTTRPATNAIGTNIAITETPPDSSLLPVNRWRSGKNSTDITTRIPNARVASPAISAGPASVSDAAARARLIASRTLGGAVASTGVCGGIPVAARQTRTTAATATNSTSSVATDAHT
jgi:hypothetical protein